MRISLKTMADDELHGLCPHHALVLRNQGWRGHWPHEDNEDFINRVAEYRKQCNQCENKEST